MPKTVIILRANSEQLSVCRPDMEYTTSPAAVMLWKNLR